MFSAWGQPNGLQPAVARVVEAFTKERITAGVHIRAASVRGHTEVEPQLEPSRVKLRP